MDITNAYTNVEKDSGCKWGIIWPAHPVAVDAFSNNPFRLSQKISRC